MANCIVIVGGTGTGKTTLVKSILEKTTSYKCIFDVNNEYKIFANIYKNSHLADVKNFLDFAKNQTEKIIVFEEATIFFSHGGATEEIKSILVRKRHTKNLLIFNFHNLRQVPLFILDFCDLLILKKTKDVITVLNEKFKLNENILNAHKTVSQSNDKFATEYIKNL